MHTINLTIKKNYLKKDGTTPIYLQYNITREKRKLIKTGKNIEPEYWNQNSKEVRRSHDQHLEINNFLKIQKNKLESIIDKFIIQGVPLNPDKILDEFAGKVQVKRTREIKSLIEHLDDFISIREKEVVNDVRKDYLSLRKHLLAFEKMKKRRFTFAAINFAFYKEFVDYLEYHAVLRNGQVGLQKNSVGKVIKNLKVFIRHSMKYGHCDPIDLSEFKVFSVQTVSVYVNEDEIEQLLSLDLSNHSEEWQNIRDLFIVGCETGLRYSDFSRLTSDYIHGDFIRIHMKKTTRPVVIPISRRLRGVIEKHQGTFPRVKNSMIFNSEIKKICRLAGINELVFSMKQVGNEKLEERKRKYEMISTHTCRRSFCTNQFMKGIPSELIRKISGHADEKSFLRYIRINEEESAEKMLDLWRKLG